MPELRGKRGKWFRAHTKRGWVTVSRAIHRDGTYSIRVQGLTRHPEYETEVTLPLGDFLREIGLTAEMCRAALEGE
jgi:hypothetical protein